MYNDRRSGALRAPLQKALASMRSAATPPPDESAQIPFIFSQWKAVRWEKAFREKPDHPSPFE